MPKCKVCAEKFTPTFSSFQKTCDKPECLAAWGKHLVAKEKQKAEKQSAREFREWKKEAKEKLMTLSDYIQICQKVFNTYIRLRDKNLPCISCGKKLGSKFDAGHYFNAGGHQNLRFHEDNVFGQCVHCNRDKHGNLIAYREGLIARIGEDRFNALQSLKNGVVKYSIPEVKELIAKYRKKIKELNP